jgi:hypothetical protein
LLDGVKEISEGESREDTLKGQIVLGDRIFIDRFLRENIILANRNTVF